MPEKHLMRTLSCCGVGSSFSSLPRRKPETTIFFVAKKIVTMNPSRPTGTVLAVRNGKILGVGNSVEELHGWIANGVSHMVNTDFQDKILYPGFIEAHGHAQEGLSWQMSCYVGRFGRKDPDGTFYPDHDTPSSVIEEIKKTDKKLPADETLTAWGFDDIYFSDAKFTKESLDAISTTRPIILVYASGHVLVVNSKVLQDCNIAKDTNVEGVLKGDDGEPNGVLQETKAMLSVAKYLLPVLAKANTGDSMRAFGKSLRNAGITTSTDLGTSNILDPNLQKNWSEAINDPDFPARIHIVGGTVTPTMDGKLKEDELAPLFREVDKRLSNDKQVWCRRIKFVPDGSIQGWTAVMAWPGYITGEDHGIAILSTEKLRSLVSVYNKAGFGIHCHCNGSQTVTDFLDAVEEALDEHPRVDPRHTVEHTQLATQAHYQRMANMKMCCNIFSNHVYFWGDQHYSLTVGPDRAECMNAAGSALRHGVKFSLHSDAPVTPPGALHLIWCAVNRLTVSGKTLGEYEKIPVYEAIKAMTLNAAYILKVDHLVGSLECGKFADCVILDQDPLEVNPLKIKDIKVVGTILGGKVFLVPEEEK